MVTRESFVVTGRDTIQIIYLKQSARTVAGTRSPPAI
jgi:hypothetical protein